MKFSRSAFFLNIHRSIHPKMGECFCYVKAFMRFWQYFGTEQYSEKLCKGNRKITVMGFFFGKVAGFDLTGKRTSSQFLSQCFVKFFISVFFLKQLRANTTKTKKVFTNTGFTPHANRFDWIHILFYNCSVAGGRDENDSFHALSLKDSKSPHLSRRLVALQLLLLYI